MEEYHRTHQQGGGRDTITGVHGRSRRAGNMRQWTARRLEHTPQHANDQQRNGHRQHQPDDREARGTGNHTDESPAWTDTKQPKREPAIKKQAASTRPRKPTVTQQTASPSRSDRWPPREKIYLSKESMAMVKEAVALGRLLPPDASRDEIRAYNKLAGELSQQTR